MRNSWCSVITICFNLAIEMLVISGSVIGTGYTICSCQVSISQSRFLSFQGKPRVIQDSKIPGFNLAIEILVISGRCRFGKLPSVFQRFNLAIEILVISGFAWVASASARDSFNLAIEILVISGAAAKPHIFKVPAVSISQSRFLSFQGGSVCHAKTQASDVSISQSRCLSFQAASVQTLSIIVYCQFQSRNRDACHFRST